VEYVKLINSNNTLKTKIMKLSTLVVSEYFALSGVHLNKISDILVRVRNAPPFFGGIRVVPQGDILQLLDSSAKDGQQPNEEDGKVQGHDCRF